jgi:hypothetical protein
MGRTFEILDPLVMAIGAGGGAHILCPCNLRRGH